MNSLQKPVTKKELKEFIVADKNLPFFGFSELQLMESVGKEIALKIEKSFPNQKRIVVFSGPGNNGGDGIVVARHLADKKEVKVFIVTQNNDFSQAYLANLEILNYSNISIDYLKNPVQLKQLKPVGLAVDALFGTGVKGMLMEPFASTVKKINEFKQIVSIDLPSPGVKPSKVYSIEIPKTKNCEIIKMGVPKNFFFLLGPMHVKNLLKPKKDSHKGENGQTCFFTGSKLHHGASVFAIETASKFCDLVFALTEKENVFLLKKHTIQAIVAKANKKNIDLFVSRSDSLLLGPGMNTSKKEERLVNRVVKKHSDKKIVLDASALRVLNPENLHKNCLVTPHKNEFYSLFGVKPSQKNVLKTAKKYDCIILLKSRTDLVSNGEKLFQNITGNEGMSVGGTGDILAGLCAALASKNGLFESAKAGVFLTGLAGDLLYERVGPNFNARDLISELSHAKKWCDEY